MATITTAVYLEDSARTAGEAMTINGGSLTVRTDTRWHANSPASMTGSLGAVTISSTLGGSYILDGRDVRWLPYDGGTGNVPAVATSLLGDTSGANAELLGVWASLTSAPTTVGSAMPASGFLKLKWADAAFIDNETITGIGAVVNGTDVTGWIEVVHDQSIAITVPRLGNFTVRGDWFYLDNTSGSSNQLVQIPTNGSSGAYVPGVWIETSSGSDVYEFWPSLHAAGMTTTNLGTDARSKFVCMETNGQIRIGHNGITTVGAVPTSGCKIRVPNVFGRQCATGTRATNASPHATAGSRPDFTTTNAGVIDVEYMMSDWYHYMLQPYSVKFHNFSTFDYVSIAECATAIDLNNGGSGTSQSIDARTLTLTSCFAGGTITDWKCHRFSSGTTDHACEIIYTANLTLTRVYSGIITFARSTGMAYQITQSTGITFDDCYQLNSGMQFTTAFNCSVDGIDHCDRYVGTTNTTGIYAIYVVSSCDDILIRDVTFGLKGTISNVHPYSGIFNVGQSKNIKLRECGTRSTVLSGGSANNPAYIFVSSGNNSNMMLQRIYMTPTRTGAISTTNSDDNIVYEHIYGDMADTMVVASLNSKVKNCGATNTTSGQSSVYGTHFWDVFTSDTAGRIVLSLNEPTTKTSSYITYVSGTPKFTSAGDLVLATLDDEVIIEQNYFVKGVTAFPATAPVVTGTNVTYVSGAKWGNHDIYYQIDNGSGWNGTWKDLNSTNLSGESADPAVGVRFKYQIVCNTTSSSNLITYIRISTSSTLSAQSNNLYPLDIVPVSLNILDASDSSEIESARILLRKSVGTTVTITRSGSTATVTHTAHGLSTNQKVVISGAEQGQYNGVKTITYVDANSYTFSVSGTPSTPATGTITSYDVVIDGSTDSNGKIENTEVPYSSDFDVIGIVRKGTSSPLYKPSPLAGTISSAGLAITAFMVGDD